MTYIKDERTAKVLGLPGIYYYEDLDKSNESADDAYAYNTGMSSYPDKKIEESSLPKLGSSRLMSLSACCCGPRPRLRWDGRYVYARAAFTHDECYTIRRLKTAKTVPKTGAGRVL